MNNISRRNFALLELSQCIKPSVGLLHYVVAVHCPSEVLRKVNTEELKFRDLINIEPTNGDWARNPTIVVKKVSSHGLALLLLRMANCEAQPPNRQIIHEFNVGAPTLNEVIDHNSKQHKTQFCALRHASI